MADCVDADIARACLDELADFGCDVLRPAERRVAPRRLTEVHCVSLAQMFGRDLVRRFDARAERAEQMDRAAEGGELAADALGFLTDEIHSFCVALGRDDVGHPSVAVTGGALQRSLRAAADPDRRAAGSGGPPPAAAFADTSQISPVSLAPPRAPPPL